MTFELLLDVRCERLGTSRSDNVRRREVTGDNGRGVAGGDGGGVQSSTEGVAIPSDNGGAKLPSLAEFEPNFKETQ